MSYPYAGDDTSFPATADLLEDGDVWNGVTAVEGMIEPLYDRTAYLNAQTVENRPALKLQASASGGGTLTILRSRGITSATYVSGSVVRITMSNAMPTVNYVVVIQGRTSAGTTAYTGRIVTTGSGVVAPTTTQFDFSLYDLAGVAQDMAASTYIIDIAIDGM
jgi:hypothetical protein